MTLLGAAARAWRREPTYVQRQLLFALVFVITVVGLPATGQSPTSWAAFIGSIVCIVGTTIGTAVLPWRRFPAWWRSLIPLGSMMAVGLLRAGTGENTSPYSFLLILPALAVGAEVRRRWPLVFVALGCAMVVFLPYVVLEHPAPFNSEILLRGLFTPFVATLAAVAVHELTRTARDRLHSMRALQHEAEKLLLRTQRDAEELSATTSALQGALDAFGSVLDGVTEQSIIATDRDGTIRIFNPGAEKLLAARREDVLGCRAITDFHLPAELAETDAAGRSGFAALVAEAAAGRPAVLDRTYVGADGRELWVQVAVTPRHDARGKVIGYLFVATDMTETREVARLKDEFVSLISHELRTPLSSILGYLELVLEDEEHPLTDEQVQYLSIVDRNANRLLRLVGDLLFTAQVEAGKFVVDERPVDLVAAIAAAAETVVPVAARAGVRVESRLPQEPVQVSGDAGRLGQACDNLLSNAVKFTPQGGDVCITLRYADDGDAAIIEVRDTGYGISAEDVASLGQRFFRASAAAQHAVPGAGLGLSITRAIVLAHRGEMTVRSVEGAGTTFSVRLPLSQATSR